jgi:restriction system protein
MLLRVRREVLVRLNDGGDATLRERREVLKWVVEFEDFSTRWSDDQLKAKGLVSEIRRVIDIKYSFGRMRQEREVVKKDLYSLFGPMDPQKRGKKLEGVLNRLFRTSQILIHEAFVRIAATCEGIVEQIDGVIELDGEIYLVEMK